MICIGIQGAAYRDQGKVNVERESQIVCAEGCFSLSLCALKTPASTQRREDMLLVSKDRAMNSCNS